MSITGYPGQERICKNSVYRKDDSGELDVFEAARYFAGTNEGSGYYGSTFSHKGMREERQAWGGRRVSLDMPMKNPFSSQSHQADKQLKEKKYKQPSSPGGRLAKLLNSIFNQAVSKKKKSKSTTQSVKDQEESPGGRRKRRSSISHFRSASATDSKSMYSSSSSGIRTPPPYANTPTKSYKDMLSYSDHKQVLPLSKHNGQVRLTGSQHEVLNEKRNMDLAWFDEKLKFYDGFSEKSKNYGGGSSEKDRMWVVDNNSSNKNNFRKFDEVADGGESDSSSDLFELENYDLGFYSSGLPVYETTHMESIKRGVPIASGTL